MCIIGNTSSLQTSVIKVILGLIFFINKVDVLMNN